MSDLSVGLSVKERLTLTGKSSATGSESEIGLRLCPAAASGLGLGPLQALVVLDYKLIIDRRTPADV